MLVLTHDDCLRHEPPEGHPERPDRLRTVLNALSDSHIAQKLEIRDAQPARMEDIARVHPQSHWQFLEQSNATLPNDGVVYLDPDTTMNESSLSAARLAAGALVEATDISLTDAQPRVFCAVRPPGHHAEADAAMGFCLLNSVAIGAAFALQQANVDRVTIVDFDVHHGNGTVQMFADEPRVQVLSSFQHPFYPNRFFDIVRDHLVLSPFPAGSDGGLMRHTFTEAWVPAIEVHNPDLIFVSAGFDAHQRDPLANLNWQTEDYAWITEQIVGLADRLCNGRVVATLEGGYELEALGESVVAHVSGLSR